MSVMHACRSGSTTHDRGNHSATKTDNNCLYSLSVSPTLRSRSVRSPQITTFPCMSSKRELSMPGSVMSFCALKPMTEAAPQQALHCHVLNQAEIDPTRHRLPLHGPPACSEYSHALSLPPTSQPVISYYVLAGTPPCTPNLLPGATAISIYQSEL